MEFSKTALGIEFGSTRIKAVLIDEHHTPLASGDYVWENRYADGIWTYSMNDIHNGLQTCYANLKNDVRRKYGTEPETFGAIGVSGMMHGYLPFDKDGGQLAEFRTWRNTITGEAAEKLTTLFHFNIPQRWSVAHLYQAMLNGEEHLRKLSYMTTLAGYIHWRLTGKKVVGVGEASGIFPVDSRTRDYDRGMAAQFDELIDRGGYSWTLLDVLPKVLCAGENAGTLTEDGARFLDPTGVLKAGIPLAPCEGDAGTGMTATNSIRPRTGNVSAGTSDFAMVVVDKPLGVHREIDMVTTPDGLPVAMVHCNNCTSDMNAWVSLFGEFAETLGVEIDKGELFTRLFQKALEGEPDCGGLLSYNYFSGEGVTDFDKGRPLFARTPDAKFTLANFMRTHLLSALATLKIGLDILTREEEIRIERLYGHGGFFKTPGVGQRLLSAAVNAPVSVMETAGEGGPYGMALLAAYMLRRKEGESLADYLDKRVFADAKTSSLMADTPDVEGFSVFMERYKKALPVERAAVETM
ncbi:MAG: FGGY-family carbohydrate kinase [Oscillibacter sp.]|nr:FGGY-family carbohydrate kinase [Oscillibacter sp.]